jgi:hypothetical protein
MEILEEMYVDLNSIEHAVSDINMFVDCSNVQDLLNGIYKSKSQLFRKISETSVRKELGEKGVNWNVETLKLHLVASCIDVFAEAMSKQQENICNLHEAAISKHLDELSEFKISCMEEGLAKFQKMKNQINDLLPVMTAEKAREVTGCKLAKWKTPLPYLFSGLVMSNYSLVFEIERFKTRVAKMICFLENN